MEVLVAGGGIAGLTMALTCHQIGVPVRVFESMRELRPLGVGINIQPNAVRELYDLELADELESLGVRTKEWALFDRDGRAVWSEPRGLDAGYRWPQYSVHRGELLMMLHRAVLDRLGPDAIETGVGVSGFVHELDAVEVRLTADDGEESVVEGSVLIGADGLHSAVRAQMYPGEGGPRWGGAVLWRGTAPGPPIRTGASFVLVGDMNQRFVTYPISEPDPVTGLQTQNWLAELTFDPRRGWRRGDWNTRVEADEFVGEFEDWNFDWLDVPALIRRTDAVYEFPMVDREPAPHWVHGSVVLIGDAAHVMYPVGSNGASQAIVDARVLGSALLEYGVGRRALEVYEADLLDNMSALVLRNREAGPVAVLGLVDDVVPHAEIEDFMARYKTAAGLAIETLNAAPPTIAIGH